MAGRSVRSASRRGFTLVELLVAITILGLLMSLSADLLHMGERSWARANQDAENTSSVESVQSLLSAELSRAYPVKIKTDYSLLMDFNGGPNGLLFHARLPIAFEKYGLVNIRLMIEEDMAQSYELVMEWNTSGADGWHKSVLLSAIKAARFSYYGFTGTMNPSWQTFWEEQKSLPQAIKLDIEFASGDKRSWPNFVVAPMITLDATSIYNAPHAN